MSEIIYDEYFNLEPTSYNKIPPENFISISSIKNINIEFLKQYSYHGYRYEDGNTLLMDLCIYNNNLSIEIIDLLSSEIGLQNNYGDTALINYIIYNDNIQLKIVKLLSSEIEIQNDDNETALMLYLKYFDNSKGKIIKLLYKEIGIQNNILYYSNLNKIHIY